MFLPGDPLFLVFIVPVVAAFYLMRTGKARLALLLSVSLTYYASFSVTFLLPLGFIFAVSYCGSIALDRMPDHLWRPTIFWLLVALSLAPLLAYKYVTPNFAAVINGRKGFDWALTAGSYAVPIGISYYTFAAIGYVCDVYLGIIAAEHRPARVALYLAFFPHVAAGPIPRATAFLPQLDLDARFDAERMMSGIRLILVGACMKLWIADSLSSSVARVFQAPDQATAFENLLAAMIFAFQLYADFGGYSLIAIGAARLFGIRLGDNFRQPFLSPTLGDFWRAWHISLFTWLRDYVFAPLRTTWRKLPVAGSAAAIQITLILVGIWHGTGWGFLAYGTLHGFLLALSFTTLSRRNAIWTKLNAPPTLVNVVRIPITFTIVALSLVLIRAKDLPQALHIYSLIFSKEFLTNIFDWSSAFHVFSNDWLATDIALIVIVIIGDVLAKRGVNFDRAPRLAMSCVYSVCVLAILYQAIGANASKPFVYFNF